MKAKRYRLNREGYIYNGLWGQLVKVDNIQGLNRYCVANSLIQARLHFARRVSKALYTPLYCIYINLDFIVEV